MNKFILFFKTNDVLDQIEDDENVEENKDFARKFLEWDEYIRIEFDPKNGTATVLPQ